MDIQGLFLKLRKRFAGQYTGQFGSIFKGTGVEIADSRKYVVGDSKKFINWKQSAKHNDLYVSLLEQERDVHIDVLCDVNYNRTGSPVLDYLNDLMVFVRTQRMHLRFSYVDNGELRTQQLSSDHVWYILQKNLQHMIRVQKPLYHSSLSLLLDRVVQEKKRRVLMIVSDFLDISAYDVQRLKLLSQDYQVILLRLRIDSLEGVNYIGGTGKKYPSIDHLFVAI